MTNDQALTSKLWPRPVPLAQLRRRLRPGPAAALDRQHASLRRARRRSACWSRASRWPTRSPGCSGAAATPSFLVVLVALMLPPQVTVVPLYVHVGQAAPGRHPVAADRAQLVRRRVLDLPAAPVLPDDPAGVPRRGPGRRGRRVADPAPRSSSGWPSRRSPPSRCSQFLFAWNDYFGPLLYTGENADDWTVSVGLSQFRSAAPGAVEPDDGGHVLVHAAGDHPVLPRPEGVRRGRDADGGEGMKIAVSAAARRTRRSWCRGLARERERLDVDELVLHDIDAERLRRRRRPGRGGCSRRTATRGALRSPPTSTRRSTAPTPCWCSCGSAARPRGCSTRRCRCACGCIGQETTGAGGFAKALRTVPVVLDIAERGRARAPPRTPGSSTSPTRSASSPGRCSTPATARSGCATSRSASSAGSPRCSASSRRRVRVDQVGLNHLTWIRAVRVDGEDGCPTLLARRTATSSADDVELPLRAAARARRDPVVLPALLLRPRPGARRAADAARRARPRCRRSSASCWSCTATRRWTRSRRCSSSAAAPTTARRRRSWCARWPPARATAGRRRAQRRHARRACADDDVVEVPARDRPRRADAAAAGAAGAGAARPRPARRGVRAAGRRRPRSTGDPASARRALLAHPLVGQWELVDALLEPLLGAPTPRCRGAAPDERRLAAGRRRRQLQDRPRAAARRRRRAGRVRGPASSPHQHRARRACSTCWRARSTGRSARAGRRATAAGRRARADHAGRRRPRRRGGGAARRGAAPGLGRAHRRRQRHLRRAAGRHRPRLGRRHHLRRRHQLRRASGRTGATCASRARRDHRRLGRRLRPRARGARRRGARRRTAAGRRRRSSARCRRRFGLATPWQVAEALHTGALATAGWSSSRRWCSREAEATRSPPASSARSPTRSWPSPGPRSAAWGSAAGRSRCSSAAG